MGQLCLFATRGDEYFLHRLLFGLVHGRGVIGHRCEVNFIEVDVADGVVVCSLEIDYFTCQIDYGGPMGGAGNIGRFSEGVLNAYGDVKVVENVKTLLDGCDGIQAFWRGGAIKRSPNEA